MARFTQPVSTGGGVELPQGLSTSSSPTFDKVITTSNGDGTNVRIGDDAWIGDVNQANQIAITGIEDSSSGGIVFGDALANKIYTEGSGLILEANSGDMNFYMDGGMYIGDSQSGNQIVTRSQLDTVSSKVLPDGGTTGQVLSKIDGTDYNTEWTTISATAAYTSVVKHEVKLGEAVNKGQAVYVSSANGTNMIVSKASNASEGTSSKTMGLIETTGVLNDQVNVITEGLLAGLDTSTAGSAGDPVWLGTSGDLIFGLANKPVAPAHLVFIGIVTRKNAINGEIFIKPQNGFELEELHDVLIGTGYASTPADNDLLAYDTASSLWKNQTAAQAGLVSLTGSETLTNKTLTTPTIGTINSGGASTTGSLFGDITTGTVNLGSAVTAGTVNIGNGAISSGTRVVNVATNGSGTLSNTVNISSTSSSSSVINLNGTVYAQGTLFTKGVENGNAATSPITLFNNQASGNVNFVNGTSFTGQLNIGSGGTTSNKIINIGTSSSAGTTTITLGTTAGAASNINLNGNVTITGSVNASTFGPTSNTSAGYLFDSTTTGLLYIGSNLTSGNLSIANGTSYTGTINIASGGTASGTKTINIGINGQAGSSVNINMGSNINPTNSTTYVNGKFINQSPVVPGAANATGTTGQISWDANYIYVCTATNTWKRSAIATW